jgi:hypothetical protein
MKMKQLIWLVLLPAFVYAQMMGYNDGYMMGGVWGMGTFGILYLALATLVFSAIFWWMYLVVVKPKR